MGNKAVFDSILLKADDKETAVAIGNQIYLPSVCTVQLLITFLQICTNKWLPSLKKGSRRN
jgi:hypothetical protein